MTTVSVTIPPTLAFLVSNFHSLVNVKLDGGNYLMWKTQIENVLNANGFLGYIDGSSVCPPNQIRNAEGNMVTNPEFGLWKLIDRQILSCLTASLSQSTLPYVLGFDHASQVWESLANRYNSLSKTHVHELRGKLYNHTKTSTMEVYIDTIKDYAQKLAAAGNPLRDDDLIFHTLRGLPSTDFKGFKTAVRTRGIKTFSFDELVSILNGEDMEMSKDAADTNTSTVLVAAQSGHGSQSQNSQNSFSTFPVQSVLPQTQSQFGTSSSQGQNSQQQFGTQNQFLNNTSQGQVMISQPQQQYMSSPQQQYMSSSSFQNRGFGKGRGGRSAKLFPYPCEVCGRNNHTTNFCYYRSQAPFLPQYHQQLGNVSQYQQQQGNAPPQNQNVSSWRPMNTSSFPYQQQFGQQTAYNLPQQIGRPSSSFTTQPQVHFTGSPTVYSGQQAAQFGNQFGNTSGGFSSPTTAEFPVGFSSPAGVTNYSQNSFSGVQPWYFDSGATNHITNNLHNLDQPQLSPLNNGVLVGNGNTLPVIHTGQVNQSNSLQGTMHTGPISYPELL